jgi:hypothetical protein
LLYAVAVAARISAVVLARAPAPSGTGTTGTPTPGSSVGGFCWGCLSPDPAQVPKGGSVYGLLNGLYFLAVGCLVAGAVCGVIAWTGGAIVAVHVSQHGKTMLFRAAGGAAVLGLISAAIPFFLGI